MQVFGLDEAGRGPWAGPIFVSVVCIGAVEIDGLDDSKKLTASKRKELCREVIDKADFVGVGAASSKYIDKHGLTKATCYAAKKAIEGLDLPTEYNFIIDGNVDYLPTLQNKQMVVKADSKYLCVSAASIVAKVYRDSYMTDVGDKYPAYGFEKHFGYGTKFHAEAIKEHGICSEHRLSFKPIRMAVEQSEL